MAKKKSKAAAMRERDRRVAYDAMGEKFPGEIVGLGPEGPKLMRNIATRIAAEAPSIRQKFQSMDRAPVGGLEAEMQGIIGGALTKISKAIPDTLLTAPMRDARKRCCQATALSGAGA